MEKAVRYNKKKHKWSLVPFSALEGMVRVLEFGAEKYEIDNWKKGLPYTEVCESLMRHLFAFLEGEDNDYESGLHHVDHLLANALFLSWLIENKPEMDNRNVENNSTI